MNVNEKCQRLHNIFNNIRPLFFTKSDIDSIKYTNGIYIVFEKTEEAHGSKRIIRVGTHRELDNLKKRLHSHRRHSGSSVFRRKIGCAILNKENPNDTAIRLWYNKDYKLIAKEKLWETRNSVTRHITQNLSFVTLPVSGTRKEEKGTLFWEAKIISTIAHCSDCSSSEDWLGRYLPEQFGDFRFAKNLGLWLTDEVNSPILTDIELVELENLVEQSKKHG
jgi:hypothetical protein